MGDDLDLQAAAKRHLWMHFARLASYADRDVPVIARGEGCYVFDEHGKRYLDGLAGLFTVQLGHGRAELAEAARVQAQELAYFPIWSHAHPAAIRLAARVAELAPGDLQLSPPLVAGPAEFEFIETTLRSVLTEAWKRVVG